MCANAGCVCRRRCPLDISFRLSNLTWENRTHSMRTFFFPLCTCVQNIMIVDRRLVLTDFGNAQRFLVSDPPSLRRVRFGVERRPREFAPLEQVIVVFLCIPSLGPPLISTDIRTQPRRAMCMLHVW